MAKLSKEEADQLAALRAKEEAPDEEEDDGPGDDDGGHVIVLRGSRADSFLESLLGPAPKRGRNAARQPAKTQRDQKGAAGGTGDDDDQADDDAGEQDAPPPKANRYFR